MSIIYEVTTEVVKSAPPLAVTSAVIMGMSISDLAATMTVIYIALQILFLLRKHLKKKPEKGVKTDA